MNQDNLYLQRINQVINHIREHLLDDLSLNTLADVAGFSPFHFHRIFKAVTGETLNQCTNRLRLERAAALLKTSPAVNITRVAELSGFTSLPVFSRAFKKHFGISASAWDRHSQLKESKNGQILEGFPRYTVEDFDDIAQSREFQVYIRELPQQPLAYIRLFDSYNDSDPLRLDNAYRRLLAWYRSKGGDPFQATLFGTSQDDPEVTPLPLCRYDIALTIPPDWTVDGDINHTILPPCHVAYIHCVGDIYKVDRAWQYLYRYWLPRSRFQPDNLPAMEIYCQQPAQLGWETYDLECAVPVIAL